MAAAVVGEAGSLAKAAAALAIAFELVAALRLWRGDGVAAVQPMYALLPRAAAPDAGSLVLIMSLLVAARGAALAAPRSAGAWAACAAAHVAEAAVYSALLLPALVARPPPLDAGDARARGAVVYAAVLANAAIFAHAALRLRARARAPRSKTA